MKQNPLSKSSQLTHLMMNHPEQGRSVLHTNACLAQVAQDRAVDMAVRRYFSHVNPSGLGPNVLVSQAGYVLPDFYSKYAGANNVESIAAGYATVEEVWQGWLDSIKHRAHLLGLSSFCAEQTNIGVGYAYSADSDLKHYWVVITAK